jgi:hypothetical protein
MSAPIKASFNRELANEADLSMSRASPVDSANTAEDRRLSESQGNQLSWRSGLSVINPNFADLGPSAHRLAFCCRRAEFSPAKETKETKDLF